jgi:hypothetical protein
VRPRARFGPYGGPRSEFVAGARSRELAQRARQVIEHDRRRRRAQSRALDAGFEFGKLDVEALFEL